VILIVALVVGAVAAFGLLNYVRNVEGSVYDNAEPEEVWVVRLPIPKGTTAEQVLDQNMIVQSEIPASFVPATSIVDPTTELAGLVAVADLPANAPLVTGNFVLPNIVNTGITDRLEEKGMVTMTFAVDQVRGVAYQVEPGDFVNILDVDPLVNGDEEGAPAEEPVGDPAAAAELATLGVEDPATYEQLARYVYQRAEVLAIDRALTPDLGETTDETAQPAARNGGLITLAVTPEAVQMLLSVNPGDLYLSLVPPTYEPYPLPPLDYNQQVLPGEDAERLTPYGPAGGEDNPE
jgi:Flp pilus assembly protein CpaB